MQNVLPHVAAEELINALIDAQDLAQETGQAAYIVKVKECLVAVTFDDDYCTPFKVLPPPIPLHGTGDLYNESDAPVDLCDPDIKKPLRRGAA